MKLLAASSILAVLTISQHSQARTIFSPEQIISEVVGIDRPASTFSADLDGDGDQDLLVASYGDHRIGWFEYLEDSETFSDIKDIDRNILDSAVITAGDFDNDGDEDVVAWSQRTGELFSYENLGGHFGNRSHIATIQTINSLTVCNLNGDGSLDLFVNDGGLFLEGIGEVGNFLPPVDLFDDAVTDSPIILKDFDADGQDDLLFVLRTPNVGIPHASDQGRGGGARYDIAWIKNIDAPDQLGEPVKLRSVNSIEYFDVVDVDNDGDFDIVFADRHNGVSEQLYWIERIDGTDFFEDAIQIGNIGSDDGPVFAFADIDRDGDQDALITSERKGTIDVYTFEDGGFAAESSTSLNHRHLSTFQPAFITVDDYPELIATSEISRSITWYKNDGGMLEQDPTVIVDTPLSVNERERFDDFSSLDIDKDGDEDLLYLEITRNGDYTPVWLANEGSGNGYAPPQNLTKPARQHRQVPVVEDFTGDGNLDILTDTGWYEIAEDGEISFTEFSFAGNENRLIDMDGDGDLDILSVSGANQLPAYWYEVEDGEILPGFVQVNHRDRVADVADLNGDGYADIIFSFVQQSLGTDALAFLLAIDDGTNFGSPQSFNMSFLFQSYDTAVAEDFDGDGDRDVLMTNQYSGSVWFIENTDGMATFESVGGQRLTEERVYLLKVLDVDGDGRKDLVFSTPSGVKVRYALEEPFTFSDETRLVTSSSATDFLFADITGDAEDDLIVRAAASVLSFTGLGGNNFGEAQLVYGTPEQRGLWEVIAVDIDKDGDQDVMSASNGNGAISLFEQVDGGEFGVPRYLSQINGATDIVSGDFNGDGNIDSIASGLYGPVTYYQKQPDDLSFESSISTISTSNGFGGSIGQLATGYIDSDDQLDIVTASVLIRWYTYATELQFTEKDEINTGDGTDTLSVAIADLDGDGDGDIVAGRNDGRIVWFENTDGEGTFSNTGNIIAINLASPASIVAVDIDSDGDLDIVSASTYDDTIAWYPNVGGEGKFGERIVISTSAIQATKVTAADMDMDGDMDLLSSSLWDHRIVYYENLDGMGNFDEGLTLTNQAYGAQTVTTADMDGDGDPDVLYGTRFGDSIAWFPNRISESKPVIEVLLGKQDGQASIGTNEDGVIDAADLAKLRNGE